MTADPHPDAYEPESLEAVIEYFDQRADAEYFPDRASPVGNEEMRLLVAARSARHEIARLTAERDEARAKLAGPIANRVRTWVMHDDHTFEHLDHVGLDAVVEAFKVLVAKEPGHSLCPVTVMQGDKELRRVGKMVFANANKVNQVQLQEWIAAAKADPDIVRLLDARTLSNPE